MRTLLLAVAGSHRQAPAPLDPSVINFGDENLGYYGEVSPEAFITATALIESVGVVEGIHAYLDSSWLKFAYEGKTLYVAKKPLVSSIGYEQLAARGLTTGGATRVIGGKTYKIRLLKGVTEDPGMDPGGEWDDLIHRVEVGGGEPRWAEFTDEELGNGLSYPGGLTICQERHLNNQGWVTRGYPGTIEGVWYIIDNLPNNGYGWRPVLELVE